MTTLLPFRLPTALVGCLLSGALLTACSSENRSLVGHAYDNVVARDNAYFLAREKMRAVEADLYKARVNDYNHVLSLFPTPDEATATRLAADLDDIIKKASLPIQHRPGSDWTDDAYLLVGKARFYKMEFEDAVKTFRFINTTSPDINTRHAALIWLMRSFLAMKEYESAAAVSSVLEREEGTPANAKDLFLTRADYYLAMNEPQRAIDNLERAVPLVEPKNEQSRTRYILAQLYQQAGENKKSYAELNQILKRNPPYELDFYSKLLLGQVSELEQEDRTRLDKYFAKLLRNPNNKEYRDKIYYEMARLNYRQQRYPEALALLQQSARAGGSNRAQKGYTQLLAGRIYYDNLQKYRAAAAYYDSAVQAMPREVPEYAVTAERSEVLQQFAQQITIVETQDSLQALAKLSPADLDTRLNVYAQAELDTRREAEVRAKRAAEAQNRLQTATGLSPERSGNVGTDPDLFASTSTGAGWYFDNPTSMSTARADFLRKWGNRPLQDNWRIVTQASNAPVNDQNGGAPAAAVVAGTATVVNGAQLGAAPTAAPTPEAQLQTLVTQYRQSIPLTEPQLQTSQLQVEEALFALGAIYRLQLQEPTSAIETYEQLLTRFPTTKHAPEAYYSLYLLYKDQKDQKAEVYAKKLQAQFPNSSYAKLVADPEYLRRVSVTNEKMGVQLDSAFAQYKRQAFVQASATLAQARKQYPDTDLNDRAAYLNTLLTIRTQTPPTAKAAVEKFIKDYPESPLVSEATTLQASYQKYEAGQLPGALASTDKPIVSNFRPGEVDTRPRAYYQAKVPVAPVEVYRPERPAPTPAPATVPTSAATPALPTGTSNPVPAPSSSVPTPVPGQASTPGTVAPPTAGTTPATTAAEPVKPATPYSVAPASTHAIALVFSADATLLSELPKQLEAYNGRFYRAKNLVVQSEALGNAQVLVVVNSLPTLKEAQSYALKLRGPQSPLSKLRGAGYQTVVISTENLPLLRQTKNLDEYQQFYDNNFR
ncbi:tetratricopeptide repeat protein [Hymenobacter aerilatus]|uniref:Tetratricopeptide repeat protein n=1 Tax=Hymenobacter aerilatus TaxID=2932251 RepID=A0A8T9STV0_9BACT|nr:tetratricopeptide repeat protein [Hymenobacter aerilatus]UOR04434.1 tetratricopeptide repeat protein [Hymenobacter aerilatus]